MLKDEGRSRTKPSFYTQELVGKKNIKSQAKLIYPGNEERPTTKLSFYTQELVEEKEGKEPSRAFILSNWLNRRNWLTSN